MTTITTKLIRGGNGAAVWLPKTAVVVPLISTIIDWPFRTTITLSSKKSSIARDQLRTISKERLRSREGSITAIEKENILEILQAIFSE